MGLYVQNLCLQVIYLEFLYGRRPAPQQPAGKAEKQLGNFEQLVMFQIYLLGLSPFLCTVSKMLKLRLHKIYMKVTEVTSYC